MEDRASVVEGLGVVVVVVVVEGASVVVVTVVVDKAASVVCLFLLRSSFLKL